VTGRRIDDQGPATADGLIAVSAQSRTTAARLDELQVQARFARQRYDLYKARAYSDRPTSPARLRELERECARAESGLRFAKTDAQSDGKAALEPPIT
jgi:hypothetical protein